MVTSEQATKMVNMRDLVFMPFHESHMERIIPSQADLELFDAMGNLPARLEAIANADHAWTVFYKREPALCLGVEVKWPTNAEAWMVPGRLSIRHGTLLCRGARRFFDNIGPALGLRRIQIVVSVERKRAMSWAKFLKFQEEGLMKAYGPEGYDYMMYARIY